ncbi:MAG: M28 family peptidase [Gemmatimonadaceae bacterium]
MRPFALSRLAAAAVLSSLAAATADAQRNAAAPATRSSASPTAAIAELVRPAYSGERAKETVAYLDQFVRWPGNRGFDASIAHIAERLEAAGYVRDDSSTSRAPLTYRIERYPMAQPAWEPLDASLHIEGESEPVLRFATNRNMLATNSFATPAGGVTAELVDVGRGTPAELDAANVRGKVVFASVGARVLFAEAVMKRGAIGLLTYSMPTYTQPEKHRTSIQFGSVPRDTVARAWAISLSYDARERLKAAMARGPVRVRVSTQVQWTPNAVEQAVVAEVRGKVAPDERFVFSAHVQEPGANDNASGVGAQVEMARVAADLVKAGRIAPARSITMLWGLEISSTARYIQQDSVRARDIKWGLSLDMVGEDTEKTGGTFLIEKMPDPSAIWTRGEDKHSEWGGSPLKKEDMTPHYFNDFVLGRALEQAATNGWVVKTNPFEGGSDHTPFLRAKKPGLLFWHFTDQFYHTDRDRIDMVSADEMKNVGVTALVSALALTSADARMTQALVEEVTRAAVARIETEGRLSAAAVRGGASVDAERDIIDTWAAWYGGALDSFADLEVGGKSAGVDAAIVRGRAAVEAAREKASRSVG